MGLLDHKDKLPCPHDGCDGKIVLVKSNVSGKVKDVKHED